MTATVITGDDIGRIADRLALAGLNRSRAVPVTDLGPEIWLPGRRPDWIGDVTFLVVGHGGQALWTAVQNDPLFDFTGTADPIDTWSIRHTEAALAAELGSIDRTLLYPHPDCPVDLVALGRAIGWQSDSPLGLGIHPRWGLWSAFRALWLLSGPMSDPAPGSRARRSAAIGPSSPDVCAACETHDCVVACPAGAVAVGQRFDLDACFAHRADPDSTCAETCVARRACPVGPEHRYSHRQMTYHYTISRPSGPPRRER